MSEITKWIEGQAALEAYFGISLTHVVVEDYRAWDWAIDEDRDIDVKKDGKRLCLFRSDQYNGPSSIARPEFTLVFMCDWSEGNENRAAIFDNERRVARIEDE